MLNSAVSMGGIERGAVLLMALGQNESAEILKYMEPKEVQKLVTAMAALSDVSKDQIDSVLIDFINEIENKTALSIGSDQYIRDVLYKALGEEKAEGFIDSVLSGSGSKGLDMLKWMDGSSIAEVMGREHPQVIAVTLSSLSRDQAAAVLSNLPDQIRTDVIMRVATLEGIQPSVRRELNEILEKQFSANVSFKSSGVGGIKAAAEILNYASSSLGEEILGQIKEIDDNLSQDIDDNMFSFEDLVDIDDRGMQNLLREVQSDILIVALKGASEAVKQKIFKNMSENAAEILKDDLETHKPEKVSEVEKMQKEIMVIVRSLIEQGMIARGSGGSEDEYI
ncbi:MAG: flagellar motor switch protein FliG [Thermodesulfobacteriota bacterium]|nr:flagellar motor switch protein FliG [Thermodesulfobacteriota bacterium]